MKDVTLREVAKEAGVSLAAVSFALRNSPKISLAKREHIQAVAQRMGYRESPLVSASMARMRGSRETKYQATLGWVNDNPDKQHWHAQKMFLGARARAEELGYVLDELVLEEIRNDEPEANVRRFCQIAKARGIHGVILPNQYRSQHVLEEWPEMAVVVIGHVAGALHVAKVKRPGCYCPFHNVVPDTFTNLRIAYDALRERGYRRIGLVSAEWFNTHADNKLRAGALEFNQLVPAGERVIPFFDEAYGKKSPASFATWLEKSRPDAVVATFFEAAGWLKQLGLKVPGDIGLAHINLGPLERDWSGIDQRDELIGAAAVDLLTAHLIRNERGIPPYAKRLAVPGCWVDGKTTRSL
jgi:DNA-binding LacI/PurR family transcriptional regulator